MKADCILVDYSNGSLGQSPSLPCAWLKKHGFGNPKDLSMP